MNEGQVVAREVLYSRPYRAKVIMTVLFCLATSYVWTKGACHEENLYNLAK